MEFQYTVQNTGLSDHKEYSIGHKIPFLMNLPSPVGPRGLGLGLSGKLTPVINFSIIKRNLKNNSTSVKI